MVARGSPQEKVVWSVFQRKLLGHFSSYHRIRDHLGTRALFQCRPCLDGVDGPTTVPAASDDMPGGTDDSDQHPHDGGFKEVFVARCDAQDRVDKNREDLLKRALVFFLPVFKYRAKESEDALEKLRAQTQAWKDELEINEQTIQDVHSHLAFLRRTAGDVRRGEDSASSGPETNHGEDGSSSGPEVGHGDDASSSGAEAVHGRDDSRSGSGADHGEDGPTSGSRDRNLLGFIRTNSANASLLQGTS